jgi:hypothetical protein
MDNWLSETFASEQTWVSPQHHPTNDYITSLGVWVWVLVLNINVIRKSTHRFPHTNPFIFFPDEHHRNPGSCVIIS